jgi:hypothetical protein
MAWSASAIFREWLVQVYQASGTGYTGLDSDTVKAALYDNDITPDKDAAAASTGYNTGQWTASGNEVTDATNWVAGGRALGSKTFTTPSTGVFMFDAADLAGGGTVTLSAFYGCLVYDDSITAGTVADQGASYHYFGGTQQVTGGTATIVWHANGLQRITV